MTDPTGLVPYQRIPPEAPALALKNAVIFPVPKMPIPLAVGRAITLRAIERATEEEGLLVVLTQRDPEEDHPGPDDLYHVGTLTRILRVSRAADGTKELLLEGIRRVQVREFLETKPYLRVAIEAVDESAPIDAETEALMRNLKELAINVIRLSPRIPDEAIGVIDALDDPAHLSDLVCSQLDIDLAARQALLEATDLKLRLQSALALLAKEAEVLELTGRIRSEVRGSMERHQREAYLREQLKAIRKELGDDGDQGDELEDLALRVEEVGMPEAALKAARKELKRLGRMNTQSAEYTVSRTYLDWLLDVPWSRQTKDNLALDQAQAILDEDHYGLDKVKRRIIEFLAVRKLKGDLKGPILCLVGPPGVGKTSLGRSVARALGREFVRVSLGGTRDEAEIRGHRRTYIGSLPGRIIKGLKKAGSLNPVFMLDEIDKLGHDFRGDPASALLEVLDPEQNAAFSDHYLEVPVDLSQVLFMATANRRDTIPPPLLDRMEVLDVAGYILEEKLAIARRHLIPKQLEAHGLDDDGIETDDETLTTVIARYTREAGVRGLDRQIAALMRSVARDVATGEAEQPVRVGAARVRSALGPERHAPQLKEELEEPGVAVGMAWTPVGGDILFIEVTDMGGTGKLTITGQLGEVMKESAHAAMSWIHARAEVLGVPEEMFSTRNFHLHVPSGGIPKDGPSAGVTLATAFTSLLIGKPVRDDLAMTGEITLRGVVLPVGGIKEKVLAAARADIKEIIVPRQNEADLEEIPEHLLAELTIHLVDRIEDVLELALGVRPKKPRPRRRRSRAPAPIN